MLSSVAKETQCYVIGGSIPERDSGKLYNTSTSFGPDGAMLAKHRKVGIIYKNDTCSCDTLFYSRLNEEVVDQWHPELHRPVKIVCKSRLDNHRK